MTIEQSHVIRVDAEVYKKAFELKGRLMIATGKSVSLSDALMFWLVLTDNKELKNA